MLMSTDAPAGLRGKRVVIFGAGYIGGMLAQQALSAGAQVTILTRNTQTAEALRSPGVSAVVADLADSAWHDRIGDADYVINCVSGGGAGTEGYRHSYLQGMRSVVAWLRAHPATACVYTSSTSVYPQSGCALVDESAEVDRTNERPAILVETEKTLLALPHACGRRTVLRLAGIYGPGRHHLLEQVRSGEVAGEGSNHLNLIHRDDICAAAWHVLTTSEADGEIFNVADDNPTPKADVIAWLAAQLGVATPRFTGRPAAGRRAVTPDRKIVNEKLKRLGWRPRYADFRSGYATILGA